MSGPGNYRGSDLESDSLRYTPTSENFLGAGPPRSGVPLLDPHTSAQSFPSDIGGNTAYTRSQEPYPAWTADRQIPLSKE